jgi:olefin beta-lactone synthetase
MGVTTVLPDMDFSRPAAADPRKLLTAANDWQVAQAFASPAVWRVVSKYCEHSGQRIESLRQVFSCGAPVSADVQRTTLACVAPDAQMHTPYGATECLPVATIEAQEVLGETASRTDQGAGVCVGRKFHSIEWRVIRITDDPIATLEDAEELPPGEIGELIVRGPQASPRYVTHTECNTKAKIADGDGYWHRMGDVGWLDDQDRFWYCGRKSQRVETQDGPLFTECVEAVFNAHPDVERSALVGLGPQGNQQPVIAIQFKEHIEITRYAGQDAFVDFARLAMSIEPAPLALDWLDFVLLPVDVRHNSKIDRELLRKATEIGVLAEPDFFPKDLVQAAKMDAKMRS